MGGSSFLAVAWCPQEELQLRREEALGALPQYLAHTRLCPRLSSIFLSHPLCIYICMYVCVSIFICVVIKTSNVVDIREREEMKSERMEERGE